VSQPAPGNLDLSRPAAIFTASVSCSKGTLDLPPHVIPFQGIAFVVQLLSARQADRDLSAPPLEVNVERDDREPTLGRLGGESAELTTVNQEFARTHGVGNINGGVFPRTDVEIVQPQFSVLHSRECVREVRTPIPEGLDFGPSQHEARFEFFENLELVAGLPIPDGRRFSPGLLCHQFS
jgi:hypothetical protein